MSIATKLQKILDSKAAIKMAIAGKGGTITDATPLDEYAQAIEDLPSGSDDSFAKIVDRSIVTADIPTGTTKIGSNAFRDCTQLTDCTMPDTVTLIDSMAFYNSGLQRISISENLASVGNSAFQGTKLLSIKFPDATTTIGANVFGGVTTLLEVEIGSGITTIGNSGIASSTRYTRYRIHATVPPTLGTDAIFPPTRGGIYVPDASVNAYKTATNWSAYAQYIYPLSDYTP